MLLLHLFGRRGGKTEITYTSRRYMVVNIDSILRSDYFETVPSSTEIDTENAPPSREREEKKKEEEDKTYSHTI